MRHSLFVLCVALACTSAKEIERSAAVADSATPTATPSATPTATAPAAAPSAGAQTTEASPGLTTGSGPVLTAAEAAATYAKARRGGTHASSPAAAAASSPAAAEDNSCASDADCAFTRIDAGACCPMLCAPRVVSKKQAEALQQHVNSCRKGRICPEPMCRPPPIALSSSCEAHRCVGKPQRAPRTDD